MERGRQALFEVSRVARRVARRRPRAAEEREAEDAARAPVACVGATKVDEPDERDEFRLVKEADGLQEDSLLRERLKEFPPDTAKCGRWISSSPERF